MGSDSEDLPKDEASIWSDEYEPPGGSDETEADRSWKELVPRWVVWFRWSILPTFLLGFVLVVSALSTIEETGELGPSQAGLLAGVFLVFAPFFVIAVLSLFEPVVAYRAGLRWNIWLIDYRPFYHYDPLTTTERPDYPQKVGMRVQGLVIAVLTTAIVAGVVYFVVQQ